MSSDLSHEEVIYFPVFFSRQASSTAGCRTSRWAEIDIGRAHGNWVRRGLGLCWTGSQLHILLIYSLKGTAPTLMMHSLIDSSILRPFQRASRYCPSSCGQTPHRAQLLISNFGQGYHSCSRFYHQSNSSSHCMTLVVFVRGNRCGVPGDHRLEQSAAVAEVVEARHGRAHWECPLGRTLIDRSRH